MNQSVPVLAGCGEIARVAGPHLPRRGTPIRKSVHRTPRDYIHLICGQSNFTLADLPLLPREHAIGVQSIADASLSRSNRR
jgi:hypothetical protein